MKNVFYGLGPLMRNSPESWDGQKKNVAYNYMSSKLSLFGHKAHSVHPLDGGDQRVYFH